ncbi:hypothetical protein [Desulfuromonas thiophila]|uniref:DUF5666 domain-containing protein n=1 Tax=Desulfuromonas thiophila TaxID=57664 RepID=A0A1G7E2R8_9BACT|nr:hypothetical protein [Desulfuromonas thiophila]SDE57909.1 hypothetical protein SAMN05661003_11726 [Desulfuromonas thiophila]
MRKKLAIALLLFLAISSMPFLVLSDENLVYTGKIKKISETDVVIGDRLFHLTENTRYYRTSGHPARKDAFKSGTKILWSYTENKDVIEIGLIDSPQD